ncbi:VSP [Giardia duodenalis ATCC 50581]|uniref:VSP n=1 Tax=Giardia intestinalis (strain ATCC 50581 / GS clone H7) TaxID=598745 RepID=C6LNK7_GIAIB|nr:VSP [Giardia intestinalis ATCC 50581]
MRVTTTPAPGPARTTRPAGACDAIVIGASGEMTYYCSLCGDSTKIPIDGKCVPSSSANGNTCENGVCKSCTANYFLYMGGCYKVDTTPGNLMCSKATTAGVCDTLNANSRYFAVPGQQTMTRTCRSPLSVL